MNARTTIGSIIPTLEAAVLEALERTNAPLSLSEIHDLAGEGSISGIRKALLRLAQSGVVLMQGVPPRYMLNRDHLAYPAIERLSGMSQDLYERIRESVSHWETEPEFVGMFGSVARGEADFRSDVDVLVVGEPADDDVEALASAIERWTGSPGQVLVLSVNDLKDAQRRREPIIAEWAQDLVSVAGVHKTLSAV